MKKLAMMFVALLLFLSACAPKLGEEEVVQEKNNKQQKAVIPKYNISDSYYRMILPFKPSGARGQVVENLNTRLDVDEFETGLMRLAQDRFSPKDYLFQEGQYLHKKTVESWLRRKLTKAQLKEEGLKESENVGLNPMISDKGTNEEKNTKSPIYLASILEHDYLVKTDNGKVQLGGVVLGLALNSVHYYETEQGYPREVEIKDEIIEREGKRIAAEVLSRVRNIKGLKDVPITIALFKQAPKTSIIPGHFFAVANVDQGSSRIDDWEKINEEYYLFPSDEAQKNHREDVMKFLNFKSDIEEFFPNYTGVIGKALYRDDQLQQLTIDISMQFYGKAEVIGFTQYVTGLVMEQFPDYITVNVYISSVGGPESIIVRQAKSDQPFVHIYQ
ncbi:CamS family sex pheromone protein [Thermaerobacillus caldiproteolyticus]|uniref:Protein involved in sex pheromone biosynthesis n=1 Tax=Thermaerobacillus caldiproteolyticus TaxID=247480 RepID=A0A7W0C128_9BACL|nr:CamS family sex pheromone protein [Anoxybacillus caldiproteolyticus]MBA2876851.1 protein involved in sex pheromone biosynthesis [Anoxybacillus caldiproteolyticus]QPA31225.1 CamS family sex pheromone protein [Anoxybacillus caldiproteolyticus]